MASSDVTARRTRTTTTGTTGRAVELLGIAVMVAALGVGGCGSSSSTPTGTTTGVVSISNLRVTQVPTHGIAFTVDFVDPSGSITGGTCNAQTSVGELSIPILGLLNGASPTSQAGTLQCQTGFNPSLGGTAISGTFSVTDQQANLSNALAFNAVIP